MSGICLRVTSDANMSGKFKYLKKIWKLEGTYRDFLIFEFVEDIVILFNLIVDLPEQVTLQTKSSEPALSSVQDTHLHKKEIICVK